MDNRPIGFIDSGVGGLSVVKQALVELPHESLIYLGDNLRCPYGTRSEAEIYQYTLELAQALIQRQIKLLVISCNTATAVALEGLQAELPIPVIGVIDAGVQQALKASKNHRIGVIATQATVASGVYEAQLEEGAEGPLTVKSHPCPLWVEIVETGQANTDFARKIIEADLAEFVSGSYDTLIMGCTHFPLLEPQITETMGPKVTLVNSGKETVAVVKDYLVNHQLQAPDKQKATYQYLTSGSTAIYEHFVQNWLGQDLAEVLIQAIQLEGVRAWN